MILQTCPKNFKPNVRVVGCFIFYVDKFLLIKRAPGKIMAGEWGMPAGKIDAGESKEQALVREVWEETGIDLELGNTEYLGKQFCHNEKLDQKFEYLSFLTKLEKLPDVKLNPIEHVDFEWVTIEESKNLDLMWGLSETIDLYLS